MKQQRRAPEWLTGTAYAHRGLHSATVPENSLAAADGAIAAGLGIECDIQRSGDGAAFVFHDWDLARLTGEAGQFGDRSQAQLEALRLRGGDQSPVTLGVFLEAVAGRVPLLIEIKSLPSYNVIPSCRSVCEALAAYGGHHAVMSFDPRVPQWFAERAPDTCRGLVGTDSLPNGFENVWRKADSIERAKPDFLAIDRRDLAQPEARRWQAAGRPLLSWTIRTASEWSNAAPLADALIAEGDALS